MTSPALSAKRRLLGDEAHVEVRGDERERQDRPWNGQTINTSQISYRVSRAMYIQNDIIGESGVLTDWGGEHGVWHIEKRISKRAGEGWGWGRGHGVGDGELVALPVAPLVS